jgi:hypothetical protein
MWKILRKAKLPGFHVFMKNFAENKNGFRAGERAFGFPNGQVRQKRQARIIKILWLSFPALGRTDSQNLTNKINAENA